MDRRQSFGSGLFGTNTMDIPGKNFRKVSVMREVSEQSVCMSYVCVLEIA